ncbi:MAG: UDP-glucose/GDP-mannose dehydrogenase family protein, partial [Candidatus Marinimicrobia bacterium]|nr:UDP-glucose/GDP-mannose dehydrogenase family protein [Candidatus Neomarinimicrobiota bacterium]
MKKITIVGTGYVGLVTGAGLSDFGNDVTCVDISKTKINDLKNGIIPIYEPGLDELILKNTNSGRLKFSTNIEHSIQNCEVIFIAVGTPEKENGEADLSSVLSVAKTIAENITNYVVVCTKSTVPVGTGTLIVNYINQNKKSDIQFDYVSNPEFLREGSAVKDFLWPDRIVIGARTTGAYSIMEDIYKPLYRNKKQILLTNIETAEMIKYSANAFLALKISYINEVANLCEKVGADVHQVAIGMGQDGRISSKFLHPGPGFGGSCFPKDTKAFSILSEQHGISMKTIDAAIDINEVQKVKMFDKLNKLLKFNLNNKTISILGLSFKPNTDDVRESPAIDMIKMIIENNGFVNAFDPVANDAMKVQFPNINYFDSWKDCCKNADVVVIMTEWNEFRGIDLKVLKKVLKNPCILDTRNIFSINKLNEYGFIFDNVG